VGSETEDEKRGRKIPASAFSISDRNLQYKVATLPAPKTSIGRKVRWSSTWQTEKHH